MIDYLVCVKQRLQLEWLAVGRWRQTMQIDELSLSKDPLIQPFKLKHLTLKIRIMSTSHACGLDENGLTGNNYQAYN